MRCLKTLQTLTLRVGNKRGYFRTRVSIWHNSLLNVNIVPKYLGSYWFRNLYQNLMHWTSNVSQIISISSPSNSGSVGYCVYYLPLYEGPVSLPWISYSTQNASMPNCRWDIMKESYMSFVADNGRYLYSLFLLPNVREILLAIFVAIYEFINR